MEYHNAPVAEVVIGLSFNGIIFDSNFIHEFYQNFKTQYPIIQEHGVVPTVIEKFENPNEHRLLPGFNSRKFFLNNKQNKLIQLQADRFLFNWRRTDDQEEYPHFSIVLSEFKSIYKYLNERKNLSDLIIQLEVTYVDNIYLSLFGLNKYNTDRIFKIFNFKEDLKNIEYKVSYPIRDLAGNITINLKSGKRNSDQEKLFLLETTCRGGRNSLSIDEWFDKAHIELVNLFDTITTEEAQNLWQVQQ